jgi:thioredoxin 1
MNTQPRKNFEIIQEVPCHSQPATPGSLLTKIGIISAVIVVALNVAQVTVFEKFPATWRPLQIAGLAVVLAGIISASSGFFRGWMGRDSNVIILAVIGLLLNGGMLSTGFVKPPIKGTLGKKQINSSPTSSQSGRKTVAVITQEWTAGGVIELTDATFDRAINDRLVLVDCWAPWCGPCRRMSPIIEELADDYNGKVKVCKLNVDNARNTASQLGIRGIPTIILYKNGNIIKKWIGLTDKSAIMLEINKLL